jgi:hypothetical protein
MDNKLVIAAINLLEAPVLVAQKLVDAKSDDQKRAAILDAQVFLNRQPYSRMLPTTHTLGSRWSRLLFSRRSSATEVLRQIPYVGPIRAALPAASETRSGSRASMRKPLFGAPIFWLAALFVLVLLRALLRKDSAAAVAFFLLLGVFAGVLSGFAPAVLVVI